MRAWQAHALARNATRMRVATNRAGILLAIMRPGQLKTIVMTITSLMLIQRSSVEQHPVCLCPNTKRCWKSRVLKTFEWQTDFQSCLLPRYPESRASFSSGKIKDFKSRKRITILNTSDIASLWFLAILSWRLWTLCCLWGFEKHVCHCLKCNIWFLSQVSTSPTGHGKSAGGLS